MASVVEKIRENKLRWFGHDTWRNDSEMVKRCYGNKCRKEKEGKDSRKRSKCENSWYKRTKSKKSCYIDVQNQGGQFNVLNTQELKDNISTT